MASFSLQMQTVRKPFFFGALENVKGTVGAQGADGKF